MKYKVGEKVLIRKDLKNIPDPWTGNERKEYMAGTIQTIGLADKSSCYGGDFYTMKSDPFWCFTDEMIERKVVDMFTKDDLKTGDEITLDDGWEGIVCYGSVRDVDTLEDFDIGIQAVNAIPVGADDRGFGEHEVPVNFAGVTFLPGDHLYADNTGIILSPEPLDLE